MADSPLIGADGVLRCSVLIEGNALADSINVLVVEVNNQVNHIPHARIVISDGDMPNKDFPVSAQDCFKPGNSLVINAGYESEEQQIFSGVIMGLGIDLGDEGQSTLVVECQDLCVAMTIASHNCNFVSLKDSEIISQLIGNYSGLSVDVSDTATTLDELVQFNATDWDFMLTRAEVNGLIVVVQGGVLTIAPPCDNEQAVLTVTYGEDLISFNAQVDAAMQLSDVRCVSWDPATQALLEQSAAPITLNQQGNLSSEQLASVLSVDKFKMQSGQMIASDALKDWANAQQTKSALTKIRGKMSFQGSHLVVPGCLIEVAGVGERFNGSVFVSRVHHHIFNGQWLTEVEFGMSNVWSAEHRDIGAVPASGMLPPVDGLQVGKVLKLSEDPQTQNRIQVDIPILEADTPGVWARLASCYASDSFGAFFIPEVGDEVVVGYFNNNPSQAVVLGSLYSSSRNMPYALEEENNTKAIVTRSELKVIFDEENKAISITTPAGNTAVLSDDDKSIVLTDQNNNKVSLTESGISLSSPKDINIDAQGTISITAASTINVEANSDLSMSALNIDQSAQMALTAQGSASAELSSTGQTTVKGAMVMIN